MQIYNIFLSYKKKRKKFSEFSTKVSEVKVEVKMEVKVEV